MAVFAARAVCVPVSLQWHNYNYKPSWQQCSAALKYQTHHIIFQLRQQLRNLLSHISATRHCPDLLQDARLGPLRFLQQLEPVSHQVGINCIIWLLSVFRIIPNHSESFLCPVARALPQPCPKKTIEASSMASQSFWESSCCHPRTAASLARMCKPFYCHDAPQ